MPSVRNADKHLAILKKKFNPINRLAEFEHYAVF
jgi:hypothetical protein